MHMHANQMSGVAFQVLCTVSTVGDVTEAAIALVPKPMARTVLPSKVVSVTLLLCCPTTCLAGGPRIDPPLGRAAH